MMKYRIVRDDYLGYEVQFKSYWFSGWKQADFCNTHSSIEDAKKHIQRIKSKSEDKHVVYIDENKPSK